MRAGYNVQGGQTKLAPVDPSLSLRLLRCGPGNAKVAPETLSHPSPRKIVRRTVILPDSFPRGPRLMREFCAHSLPEALQEKRTAASSKAQSLRKVSPSSSPTSLLKLTACANFAGHISVIDLPEPHHQTEYKNSRKFTQDTSDFRRTHTMRARRCNL